MSHEASAWALTLDPGSPGAKLLLLVLANHAGKDGVTYVGRVTLATECCCRPETISAHFAKLEALSLLKRLERRRDNGSKTSQWIVLAPECEERGAMVDASLEDRPEPVVGVARKSSGEKSSREENAPGQVGISGSPESLGESVPSSTGQESLDIGGLPHAIQRDMNAVLKTKAKVAGRLVQVGELTIAGHALDEFNRLGDSNYGLAAQLTKIVGRIRERPSFGNEDHRRIVASAWRLRWWERKGDGRRPSPGVIYGNRDVFEQVVQDMEDEAKGKPSAPKAERKYVRKGPVSEI